MDKSERSNIVDLLWELTVAALIEDIKDPERRTPGVLQAANRFLEDNKLESLPERQRAIVSELANLPYLRMVE